MNLGVGDVVTGRVKQGRLKPGEEVICLPTHTASNLCFGDSILREGTTSMGIHLGIK